MCKTGFRRTSCAGQAARKVQKARRFAITPEECAAAIRRGVERDARTVVTPALGLAAWCSPCGCFPSIVRIAHGRHQRNRMNLKLKRTPGIYVVGFMAAGKSTVGRHLAHRLGWNFFDTDAEIEAAEKTAIADLFATRGEPEFRRIETDIIRQHVRWIERGRPAVLALGGGAFASPPTATCSKQRHHRLAGLPFETVAAAACAQATHSPAGARSRQLSQRSTKPAATHYSLADVHIPIDERRPRNHRRRHPGPPPLQMTHQASSAPPRRSSIFRAALAAADPADAVDRHLARAQLRRASAIST